MSKTTILGIVLIIAGIAVWIARPSYRGYKERKFAAQARQELAKGDQRRALLSARQALMLNSNNVAAAEVMADLADMGNSPHAISWRQRIAELNPAVSNQIALAACALRYEQPPFPFAGQALAKAAAEGDKLPAFHVVAAQLALKLNRPADAKREFQAALRLDPTNSVHRLNLATIELESRDTAESTEGRQQLLALRSDPSVGIVAARSLAQHEVLRKDYKAAQQQSADILKHPGATFDDSLVHARILFEGKLPEFEPYVAGLKQQAGTNAVRTFSLASLLLSFGQTNTVVDWLKSLPAGMRDTQPVPLAVANAYAASRQWRAMEDFLKAQSWKEQEATRLALLALAVRNQKDETVAMAHWNNAIKAAADRPEQLASLAQMAGNWGWKAEMQDLLWRIARDIPDAQWALEALHNSYAQQRDTRGLYSIYSYMLDHGATNVLVRNNYASISMLLNTNVAKAHQLAEAVYRADTNNFGFVSTYAWSKHLQGDDKQALALMEGIGTNRLAEPAVAAYYGALLAANGKTEQARTYLTKAQSAEILPEEKAIAVRALASLEKK